MRTAVAAQGDEGHLFAAGPLDATAVDDVSRKSEQHHLQKHRRRIRRGTRRVVAKPRIEARQIDLVLEQVIQGVSKVPGNNCCARSTGSNRGLVSMCL